MNQLNQGIRVESEHKGTYKFIRNFVKKHGRLPKQKEMYKSIAHEHLKEDKNYYKKLKKARL